MATYNKDTEMLSNMGATLEDVSNLLTHECANCESPHEEIKLYEAQELIDQVIEGRKK